MKTKSIETEYVEISPGDEVMIGNTVATFIGVDGETGKAITSHVTPGGVTVQTRVMTDYLRSVTVAALLMLIFCLFTSHASAQINGDPMPFIKPQFFTNGGLPAAGYKLCTYSAGTNNPIRTYTTSALSVPNTNPLVLDSAGRGSIFWPSVALKVIFLTDKSTTTDCLTGSLNTVWSVDNVETTLGLITGANGANHVGFEPTGGDVLTTVGAALNSTFLYDIGYSTLQKACDAGASAGKPVWVVTARAISSSFTCNTQLVVPLGAGGVITPASGQTLTFSRPFIGGPASLSLVSGGLFASSLSSPQTVQSQWFVAADYGARVAAAAVLQSGARGTVDGVTGEGGTLVISNGEDIYAGCVTYGCTINLRNDQSSLVQLAGLAGAGSGTQAGIVVRSNSTLTGAVGVYNLPANGNHGIETFPDSSNISLHVYIDGRQASSGGCEEHNFTFLIGATTNLDMTGSDSENSCADAIGLEPGLITSGFTSGRICNNHFAGFQRDGITVNSGKDLEICSNRMENPGADFIHAEPDSASLYVQHIHDHHNTLIGRGATTSGGIVYSPHCTNSPSAPTDFCAIDITHFSDILIDNDFETAGEGIISYIPKTIISNNDVTEAVALPAIQCNTYSCKISGGTVSWTTALASGSDSAVGMNCKPNNVPSVGLGHNTIEGVTITNAAFIGILNFGCNNAQIQNNLIRGVCAVGGVARGIEFSDESENDDTGVLGLAQGNTLNTSTGCSSAYEKAMVDTNNKSGRSSLNYFIDNFVLGAATTRYDFAKNNVDQVRDTVPIAYASRSTDANPAIGSWMFCSDCKNVTDDMATFDATVQNGGSGANMAWESIHASQTDWRNH